MIEFVEMYIGALSLWICAYICGLILLGVKDNKVISILYIAVFSILLVVLNNYDIEIFHGIIKIICIYILLCVFYKMAFKESIYKIMSVALTWYILLCISEVLIVLLASIIISFFNNPPSILKNMVIMNMSISILNLYIIYKLQNALIHFINNKNIKKINLILLVVILITMSIILFRRPVRNWRFDAEFVITMLTLFGFCVLATYLMKQRADIEKTTSMYQQVVKYSNTTNKLLEDYRMVSHEHKNQLSIIRQMIKDADNRELIEYIDNLINKRNDIKYKWVADLNHLTLEGLKGLINYKLLEIEDSNINSTVVIAKEISRVKLNKLSTQQKDNLYSIVGVYLDNAIQAAKESKRKEISLEIFREKKDIVLIIANTYKGIIKMDRLDEYGYTTKGKNHGIGLHIVKNIMEEDKIFTQSRKISNGFYIQELRIHTSDIKKQK